MLFELSKSWLCFGRARVPRLLAFYHRWPGWMLLEWKLSRANHVRFLKQRPSRNSESSSTTSLSLIKSEFDVSWLYLNSCFHEYVVSISVSVSSSLSIHSAIGFTSLWVLMVHKFLTEKCHKTVRQALNWCSHQFWYLI